MSLGVKSAETVGRVRDSGNEHFKITVAMLGKPLYRSCNREGADCANVTAGCVSSQARVTGAPRSPREDECPIAKTAELGRIARACALNKSVVVLWQAVWSAIASQPHGQAKSHH